MDENFCKLETLLANANADAHLDKNLLKHFEDIESIVFGLKAKILQCRANNENVEGYQNLMIELIQFLNCLIFKITAFGEEELPIRERGMISDFETVGVDLIRGFNRNFQSITLNYDLAAIKHKLDSNKFESDEVRKLAERDYDILLRIITNFYN